MTKYGVEEDEERLGSTDGGSIPNTGRTPLHDLNRKFSQSAVQDGVCVAGGSVCVCEGVSSACKNISADASQESFCIFKTV